MKAVLIKNLIYVLAAVKFALPFLLQNAVYEPHRDESFDAKNEYYEFLQSRLNDLKERYKKYAKVFVEEQSVDGVIGGLPFEKTEITARVPEEIIYNMSYYHGFHQGYQILLCAMFSGEKKGMDMVRHIEEARFTAAGRPRESD